MIIDSVANDSSSLRARFSRGHASGVSDRG